MAAPKFVSRLNHLAGEKNSSTGEEALTTKRPAEDIGGIARKRPGFRQ